MYRHSTLFLLILLLSNCSKVNLKKDYEEVIGDYEWMYSQNELESIHAYDSEGDRYGIQIKKKRKILFFKNGEKTDEYKIEEVFQFENKLSLNLEGSSSNLHITLENQQLVTFGFPIKEHKNYFTKIN